MEDRYLTLKSASTGDYKEKGSKFLSFAYPVSDESEVQQILDQLRKSYHDARHHCYAYVLGKDRKVHRANDDGEPHHSAGDPILRQLRSRELTNALVVVVRYFGGIKLGVGGLVKAYKAAAAAALNAGEVIEQTCLARIDIRFEYLCMDEVMHLIQRHDLKITAQHFDTGCRLSLECSQAKSAEIRALLQTIPALTIVT